MSDIVVNDPAAGGAPADTTEFFLDGDAPRLASAPTIATLPTERNPPAPSLAPSLAPPPTMPGAPTLSDAPALPGAPTLPVVSPVLSSLNTPLAPDPTTAVEQANGAQPNPATDDAAVAAEPDHPMAHLMPTKTMPNEASRRAAEKRAVHKAKSKKIKIGVISGMLIFTAVVGPPLGKWLVDAVNEAGNTSTVEEPAE